MKRKIVLILIPLLYIVNITNSIGQESQSFKSRVSEDLFVEMTIRMENTTAYVSYKEIDADDKLGYVIYNATDVKWNETIFEDPNDGGSYVLIPFGRGDGPGSFGIHGALEVQCQSHYVCDLNDASKVCDWVTIGGGASICKCGNVTSNPCTVIICDKTAPTWQISGGGVIIQAREVIVE